MNNNCWDFCCLFQGLPLCSGPPRRGYSLEQANSSPISHFLPVVVCQCWDSRNCSPCTLTCPSIPSILPLVSHQTFWYPGSSTLSKPSSLTFPEQTFLSNVCCLSFCQLPDCCSYEYWCLGLLFYSVGLFFATMPHCF